MCRLCLSSFYSRIPILILSDLSWVGAQDIAEVFAQQDSEEFGEVEYEPFAEALHKDHKLGRSEAVADDGYADTAHDAAGLGDRFGCRQLVRLRDTSLPASIVLAG